MTTWTKQKLGSVVTFRTGKLNSNAAVENGQYPFFTCSQEIYKTNTYSFDTECILLGGNNASAVYPIFYFNGKFDAYQRTYVIEPKENTNIRFMYYLLRQKLPHLRDQSTGATTKFLTLKILENIRINLPDLITQQKIASILSTYDDLIETNEKRIKILEEMAQRLYTEWFVHFRYPGHENIPLVDSHTSLGMIPEGWEVVPISKIATFVNGYPFKPSDLGTIGLPIVKIPELRSGILDKTPRNPDEKIAQKYHIKNGDILFSWSATLLVNIWNSGDALLNQHLFNVISSKDLYRTYLFYTLKILVEKLSSQVVGATMQHLRKGVIESGEILLPTEEIFKAYDSQASKILETTNNLNIENQKLVKIRDLLLPQLISGKRGVK